MRRIIMMLIASAIALAASAQYAVYSATDGVTVTVGSRTGQAKAGARLTGSDVVNIPDGGKIEIKNTANKKLFSCSTPGSIKVFDLVLNAQKSASDHGGMVGSRFNFGKSGKSGADATVYKETGMVRRSMSVYDPEAQSTEMDAVVLGRMLAAKIAAGRDMTDSILPVETTHAKNAESGLMLSVDNTLNQPVYFNIVKVCRGADGAPTQVEISHIGQPTGCYVLLPEQTLTRVHRRAVDAAESHIMVMTPVQYDVDRMMDEMRKALGSGERLPESPELPVFTLEL